jgi:hypothetical protein
MPPFLVPNDRFFLGGAGRKRQLSFFANGNNGFRLHLVATGRFPAMNPTRGRSRRGPLLPLDA